MSEENKFSFENKEYRQTYWPTCSHVLAQAMKRLHPDVKLAIGPSLTTVSIMISILRLRSLRRILLHWKAKCVKSAKKS